MTSEQPVAVRFYRFVKDPVSDIMPDVQTKLIELFRLGACETCAHWQGGKYDLQARCDFIRDGGHVICLQHTGGDQPALFTSCWFGCRDHKARETIEEVADAE